MELGKRVSVACGPHCNGGGCRGRHRVGIVDKVQNKGDDALCYVRFIDSNGEKIKRGFWCAAKFLKDATGVTGCYADVPAVS